jgi:hypothetical protein
VTWGLLEDGSKSGAYTSLVQVRSQDGTELSD